MKHETKTGKIGMAVVVVGLFLMALILPSAAMANGGGPVGGAKTTIGGPDWTYGTGGGTQQSATGQRAVTGSMDEQGIAGAKPNVFALPGGLFDLFAGRTGEEAMLGGPDLGYGPGGQMQAGVQDEPAIGPGSTGDMAMSQAPLSPEDEAGLQVSSAWGHTSAFGRGMGEQTEFGLGGQTDLGAEDVAGDVGTTG